MNSKGPWSSAEVDAFLERVRIPVRLACNGRSGHPLLASLWFVPLEDRLWCATQRTASLIRVLERDPRCAFEVSVETPPYQGVRGRGIAELHPERGEAILRTVIDRYLGSDTSSLARSLLARAESEIAISIEPRTRVSWDYRERMGDAA